MTIYKIDHGVKYGELDIYFIKANSEQDALRKAEATLRWRNDEEDDHNADDWYALYNATPIEFDDEVWECAEAPWFNTDDPYILVSGTQLMTAVVHNFPKNWDLFNKCYDMVNGNRDYIN